jgi:TPR repeat protein
MRRLLTALCLCLFALPAWAQDFTTGLTAYEKGDYERAFAIWLPLAKGVDPSAQYNVGLMYANGLGVARNDAEAVKWFRIAAKAGVPGADGNIGFMYEAGLGVAQDNEQAIAWYSKAVEKGEAAEQGLVEWQNNLGYMYETGRGVERDEVEAVKWYRRAADQDFAAAQFNLALKYDAGEGVPQDDVRAYMWYTIALSQLPVEQIETAVSLRNVVASRMMPDKVAQAGSMADEWLKKRGRGR